MFDREAAAEFLTAVRAGATNEVAAAHCELSLSEVRNWLTDEPGFAAEVRKARADLELLAVGQIRRVMTEDARAAEYIAESARVEVEFERLRRLTT